MKKVLLFFIISFIASLLIILCIPEKLYEGYVDKIVIIFSVLSGFYFSIIAFICSLSFRTSNWREIGSKAYNVKKKVFRLMLPFFFSIFFLFVYLVIPLLDFFKIQKIVFEFFIFSGFFVLFSLFYLPFYVWSIYKEYLNEIIEKQSN